MSSRWVRRYRSRRACAQSIDRQSQCHGVRTSKEHRSCEQNNAMRRSVPERGTQWRSRKFAMARVIRLGPSLKRALRWQHRILLLGILHAFWCILSIIYVFSWKAYGGVVTKIVLDFFCFGVFYGLFFSGKLVQGYNPVFFVIPCSFWCILSAICHRWFRIVSGCQTGQLCVAKVDW